MCTSIHPTHQVFPHTWKASTAHARPIIEGVTSPNYGLVARTWKAVLAIAITLMIVGK